MTQNGDPGAVGATQRAMTLEERDKANASVRLGQSLLRLGMTMNGRDRLSARAALAIADVLDAENRPHT